MSWLEKKSEEQPKPNSEQTKSDADALIAQMRSTFEETLRPVNDRLLSYDKRFELLEQQTAKPAPKVENQEVPSVLDNEDAAFAARLTPQAIAIANLNARIVESEVKQDMAQKGWGDYIQKVQDVLEKQTSIQTKADPNYKTYVQNVVKLVIGSEAMDKGLRFDSQKKTFFLEDSSRTSGTPAERSKYSKLTELASDGQIEIIKGQSPEDVVDFLQKKLGIKDVDKFLEGAQ